MHFPQNKPPILKGIIIFEQIKNKCSKLSNILRPFQKNYLWKNF
jgi:hypothetical protein